MTIYKLRAESKKGKDRRYVEQPMSKIITLQQRVKRNNAADVIIEVRVEVDQQGCHPEYKLIAGKELSRFRFIDGYRENGRDIGARNHQVLISCRSAPFPDCYIIGAEASDWHEIPTASPSDV